MWCNFVFIFFHSLSPQTERYESAGGGAEAADTGLGPPDLSNWVWEDRLNTAILEGEYIGDGAADETLSYLKGFLNVGNEEDRDYATVTLKGRGGYPQSKIFCHMGLMGMGKTRLHNELCSPDSAVGKSVVKAMEEVGKPVRFIRITYNEGRSFEGVTGPINKDTFLKHLLCFHGLNGKEAAKVNNAHDAVRHIREKLGMQAGDTLVICVDELMKMEGYGVDTHLNKVGRLMQQLLVMQDTADADAPLVFLFSAVTKEVLDAAEMASSRRAISAKLPLLSEKQLRNLLFKMHPDLTQYKGVRVFELLLKLCAPTPRYVLEGLPRAFKKQAREISPSCLPTVLQHVLDISQSKMYSDSDDKLVHGTVRNMLQGEDLTDSQKKCLADKGWLCKASNGKPSLHPMVQMQGKNPTACLPFSTTCSDLISMLHQTARLMQKRCSCTLSKQGG